MRHSLTCHSEENLMKHFELSRWVDFVRGCDPEPGQRALSQHLSEGCPYCQRTVSRLRVFSAIAANEAQYLAGSGALDCARSWGARLPKKSGFLSRLKPRLVFDSLETPLSVGVHAEQQVGRQAMYQADVYCLDLRVDHEAGSQAIALAGQIANLLTPETGLSNLAVAVVSRGALLAQAVSNQFGEFLVDYPLQRRRLKLYIHVDGKGSIEVPLMRSPQHPWPGSITSPE